MPRLSPYSRRLSVISRSIGPKADSNGTPDEVLSRLNMPNAFRDRIKPYLNNTSDLGRQSDALLDWAAENAKTYIGVLELMITNAKKSALTHALPSSGQART